MRQFAIQFIERQNRELVEKLLIYERRASKIYPQPIFRSGEEVALSVVRVIGKILSRATKTTRLCWGISRTRNRSGALSSSATGNAPFTTTSRPELCGPEEATSCLQVVTSEASKRRFRAIVLTLTERAFGAG